jgi:hypothetical protein
MESLSSVIKIAVEYSLVVSQKQFTSFEEIVKIGNFNNGFSDFLKTNEICRNAIMAPISNTEEELVLYWEGESQNIHGGAEFYNYIDKKGYEVVPKAHPSLLANAMKSLSEDKLTELGIPSDIDIVLPTDETALLPSGRIVGSCFFYASRGRSLRSLGLILWNLRWKRRYAFILRKKKV